MQLKYFSKKHRTILANKYFNYLHKIQFMVTTD